MNPSNYARWRLAGYLLFCVLILIFPLIFNNDYLLNKYMRYLVFGILSAALSFSWGYAGILNLGQAVSFGLGSYAMAMALKLRTIPIQTGAKGLPDFMVWNNVKTLPWFWEPFHSYTFAIFAGVAVPMLLALLLGWFMFRGRITGVFVAIITLAMLVVVNLLIIDQQKYTGGFNGITDLTTLKMFGVAFDAYSSNTYYLIAGTLCVVLLGGLAITQTKTGLILQAIRDDENRVRYFGYDVAAYQNFAFTVSAGVAGFAGMLYALVMEFASPTFLARSLEPFHRHLVRRRRPRVADRRSPRRDTGHRRAGNLVGVTGLSRYLDADHGRHFHRRRVVPAEGSHQPDRNRRRCRQAQGGSSRRRPTETPFGHDRWGRALRLQTRRGGLSGGAPRNA